jgi:hypothetical protein
MVQSGGWVEGRRRMKVSGDMEETHVATKKFTFHAMYHLF